MCHRNILNNFRTREVLYVRMGVMIALSLCVGSLFVLRVRDSHDIGWHHDSVVRLMPVLLLCW